MTVLPRLLPKQKHASYNLAPGRDGIVVRHEIRTLLKSGVKRLGMQEAIGYRLDPIKGYTLIRNQKTQSRANLAAYIRTPFGAKVTWHWIDLAVGWKRTDHAGQHAPRSILVIRIRNRYRFVSWLIVAHAPPLTKYGDTGPARTEHDAALKAAMKDKKRVTVVGDMNAHGNDPLAVRALAKHIGGTAVGDRIDGAVVVGGTVSDIDYARTVNNVPMRSDHKHVLIFNVRWIRTPKENR